MDSLVQNNEIPKKVYADLSDPKPTQEERYIFLLKVNFRSPRKISINTGGSIDWKTLKNASSKRPQSIVFYLEYIAVYI